MKDKHSPFIFNEDALRAEIVKTWGEHGAHAEVYDHLLKMGNRSPAFDALVEAVDSLLTTLGPRAALSSEIVSVKQAEAALQLARGAR